MHNRSRSKEAATRASAHPPVPEGPDNGPLDWQSEAEHIEIGTHNVQAGDVLSLGGRQCEVARLSVLLNSRRVCLYLNGGEMLIIHQATRLLATRFGGR